MSEAPFLAEAPELIGIDRVKCEASAAESFTNADFTSLLYIVEGRGQCCLGGANYTVMEGDLLVVHPQAGYTLRSLSDKPLRAVRLSYTLWLSGKERGHLLDAGRLPVISLGKSQQVVGSYFEQICNEDEQPSIGGREMVCSFMQAITISLIRLLHTGQPSGQLSITQQVKAYIEQQFDKELSLGGLAQLVHVSPFHLGHLFKEECGMAPIQYLIYCRIEEAKRLLRQTRYSVADISESVGYPNTNYFNQIFKKMVGISPGKYRDIVDR